MKRGQVSMEYMLVLTMALTILLPGIYLFQNYALESNEKILYNRVLAVSEQIISKAREMQYYGPPSKSVITVEMPSGIHNMYAYTDTANNENYLIFQIEGKGEYLLVDVETEVPFYSTPGCPTSPDPRCNGNCYCFDEDLFSEGIKRMTVQAQPETSCGGLGENCVTIT